MILPALPRLRLARCFFIARQLRVFFFNVFFFVLPLPECAAQHTLLDSSVVFNRSLPADTTETPRPNWLREGAWAVMLQVGASPISFSEFFRIDSFYSGYVFGKHHITAQDAVRGGLLIGLSSNLGTQNISSRQQIGLALQYLRYAKSEAVVHFFYGGGVFYISQASKFDATSSGNFDSEGISLFFGISGFLGVEWFATQHLSIHGEFGGTLGFIYERGLNDDPRLDFRRYESGYYELELLPLKLGASIYF